MALRRAVVLVVLAAFLGLPRSAAATVSVSPALSYDGSYTVSWTDWSSGQTRAYLYQSFNGGASTRITVTGTYSRAYSGMSPGDYKYQVKIYFYEPEDGREYLQSQTNIVTVTVTSAGAPGTPGAITGPTSSSTGSYALGWGASSGTVSRYELQQNGTLVYTGTALSTTLNGRSDGTYRYRVRACNAAGCGEFTAEHLLTVLLLPAAPNPVSAPAQSASGVYAVSWTKPSGFVVDGYRIERRSGTGPWSATDVGPELSYTYSNSIDGTYFHRVYARNASGFGPVSNEVAVVVELQLTETLPDNPLVQPDVPAQQWVGTLPGVPSVQGGSATYHIPIDVPPGRAGMQPELALTYSSRNGNGLVGVGWSISGTSSVYRCPRTLAQDGGNAPVRLKDDDRLCFDGKRLVLVAGSYGQDASEYRTETDPFDRITLRGGAMGSWGSYFEVEHKSGLRSHFVAMRQSSTSPLPPATWQLVRQFDRQGNCLSYEFKLFQSRGDDEEWVLSWVKYPGSMSGSQCAVTMERGVFFEYTAGREDRRTTYNAGMASMMTARLSAIVTRASNYPVRRYALTYQASAATGRSLLTSVTLCAGATCTGPQLTPTVFTYQEDSPNFSPPGQITLSSGTPLGVGWGAGVTGDFDGDGTRDKLFVTNTYPQTRTLELSSCGIQTEIGADAWFDGFASVSVCRR